MKVLAVISARGGSKGVPRKNMREFNGIPLIAHMFLKAKKCNEINKEFAEIFDFVILPFGILDKIPEEVGKFEKKLISLELPRIKEFSRLSRNKIAINGSSDFILKLEELCAEKDE